MTDEELDKFIKEQQDLPPDFEKVFRDMYWESIDD